METFNLISHLEGKLKAFIKLVPDTLMDDSWRLEVDLFYDNEPVGMTSFNLHGYKQDEAREIAQNIKHNQFIMREIDEYLWGDSD